MVRDLLITLPDRLKLAWRMLLAWIEATELRLIDQRLAQRNEERTPKLLAFDELPVLYSEAGFPIIPDETSGWSGNSTPEPVTIENPLRYDYV
jgi:hypothetical protein